jgi:hypothetical protein
MTTAAPFACVTASVSKPCFFCVSAGGCLERKRLKKAEEKREAQRKATK